MYAANAETDGRRLRRSLTCSDGRCSTPTSSSKVCVASALDTTIGALMRCPFSSTTPATLPSRTVMRRTDVRSRISLPSASIAFTSALGSCWNVPSQ